MAVIQNDQDHAGPAGQCWNNERLNVNTESELLQHIEHLEAELTRFTSALRRLRTERASDAGSIYNRDPGRCERLNNYIFGPP